MDKESLVVHVRKLLFKKIHEKQKKKFNKVDEKKIT